MKNETATAMLHAMKRHIAQRSGMEWGNYATGDYARSREAFMSDYRPSHLRIMLRDGKDARTMLSVLAMIAEWDGDTVVANLTNGQRAFSGRLTYDAARNEWEYVTGQYFPTEYREAACAVLASAFRDRGYDYEMAASTFGRGIATRWFK
jgi:hypothetical protein